MKNLIQLIREQVSPKEYYKTIFPDINWAGTTEARVHSPWVDDKDPSLSINGETGAWYSFSADDEFGGKSIVSFHAKYHEVSQSEAARQLFHDYVHPTIDDRTIRRWERHLGQTPTARKYLRYQRLLSPKILKRYRIGWNGKRFTVPIMNEWGICVNAKLYDPLAKKRGVPKMLNFHRDEEPRKYGTPPMIFPLPVLLGCEGFIVVCEGEWDALALLSIGIPAVTSTAGSKSWPTQYTHLFKGLDVVIAYDNDEAGKKHSQKYVLKHLLNVAKSVKQVQIPKKYGKDVTDWILNKKLMRKAKFWQREFDRANLLVENPDEDASQPDVIDVPLNYASEAQYYMKRVRVKALVSGKDTAPYMLPAKFRVTCGRNCDDCRLAEEEFIETTVDQTSTVVLNLTDAKESSARRLMLSMAGIQPQPHCTAKINVIQTFNVEQLLLIPTLDHSNGQYVMRSAYYVGHGLAANRSYRMEGVTIPHPKDQHSTHLFDIVHPLQGEIETFEMTETLQKELQQFKIGKAKPLAKLMAMADWQSRNITKIHERPDLHIAVDLAFHSVAGFDFNGERVHRGMLDILVLGDTRCGKGYVTERLTRYYGLGDIASGENCTFAGLVGGLQQVGNRWLVTWGIIPLNNNRLVVIDEASSLSEEEIGHMSRVRSEGIAEISKIVKESTQANTRLIWLSNPRSGRSIMSYNAGVEAIKELIGANEDISRFDLAITVATDEVPSEIINAPADYSTTDSTRYLPELCRSLILWAWSRTPDQIEFSEGATKLIIKEAINFGHTYSPTIPLVQAENIRIKLAKVAAALAARLFSSDKSGEKLIIRTIHVRTACEFLRMIYSKASMSYHTYSKSAQAISKITDPQQIFDDLGSNKRPAMTGLLELHQITPDSLADFVGDTLTAKSLIGELVRLRCISRMERGNWYLKNAAFSSWLRQHIKKGKSNG